MVSSMKCSERAIKYYNPLIVLIFLGVGTPQTITFSNLFHTSTHTPPLFFLIAANTPGLRTRNLQVLIVGFYPTFVPHSQTQPSGTAGFLGKMTLVWIPSTSSFTLSTVSTKIIGKFFKFCFRLEVGAQRNILKLGNPP